MVFRVQLGFIFDCKLTRIFKLTLRPAKPLIKFKTAAMPQSLATLAMQLVIIILRY